MRNIVSLLLCLAIAACAGTKIPDRAIMSTAPTPVAEQAGNEEVEPPVATPDPQSGAPTASPARPQDFWYGWMVVEMSAKSRVAFLKGNGDGLQFVESVVVEGKEEGPFYHFTTPMPGFFQEVRVDPKNNRIIALHVVVEGGRNCTMFHNVDMYTATLTSNGVHGQLYRVRMWDIFHTDGDCYEIVESRQR